MATFPKLPTDNLYKFVALAGMFLVALGVYLWTQVGVVMNERRYALNHDQSMVSERYRQVLAAASDLGIEKDQLVNHSEFSNTTPERREVAKRFNDVALEWGRWHVEQGYVEWLDRTFKYVSIMSAVVILLGIGVAVGGFRQWYFKVQIYEDRALELRASSLHKPPLLPEP